MVVTRIDDNAREILEQMKNRLKAEGIKSPNLSDAIRYMKTYIDREDNKT